MSARRAGSVVWALEPGRRVGRVTQEVSATRSISSNGRWSGSGGVTTRRAMTADFSDIPQKRRVRRHRRHVVDSRLFIEPWLIHRLSWGHTRARSGAHIPHDRPGGDHRDDAGADIAHRGGSSVSLAWSIPKRAARLGLAASLLGLASLAGAAPVGADCHRAVAAGRCRIRRAPRAAGQSGSR